MVGMVGMTFLCSAYAMFEAIGFLFLPRAPHGDRAFHAGWCVLLLTGGVLFWLCVMVMDSVL